jgi:hypothetical protein
MSSTLKNKDNIEQGMPRTKNAASPNELQSTKKCALPTHKHTQVHTQVHKHTQNHVHTHYQHELSYKANTRGQNEQLKEHSGAPPWNGQWQKHHWGA